MMTITDISYTFPSDCPITQLAGKTVTGGTIQETNGQPSVRFATRISGKAVIARIAGKPELEAIYQVHLAAIARKQEILAAINWPAYHAIQCATINAVAAYEQASESGYPVREADAARKADEALQQARLDYPQAAAYALAESYLHAANDAKASAGKNAMGRIECGEDPLIVVAEMQAEWSAAASQLVERA